MRHLLLLATLLAGPAFLGQGPAFLGQGPANAQGIDMSQGGPVDITATNGIEWRQAEQVVVARGDARAVRDGTTIEAARLIARYRSRGGEQPPARPAARPASGGETPMGGSSEIWRMEAEGDVRIFTPTDTARGDRAVYDMDQAVLVLTGRVISYATPQQTITSRDSLEYWTERRMAVARGSALVVTQDNRRIAADTLVAYMLEDPPAGATPAAVARPGAEGTAGPPPGQGRIDRVELFGNVEIRTEFEVIRGDRAVYSAATGLARVLGNVRITRGENLVAGREAIVNMNTGVSRILSQPGQRVQGIITPQQGPADGAPSRGPSTPPGSTPSGATR